MVMQRRGSGVAGVHMDRVSRVFSALADPVRRTILEELGAGPRGATKLGERYGISQPAISRHVRVLREAGLIRTHVQGRNRWCVLHAAGMKDAAAWVERYRVFWEGQLDALEEFVLGETDLRSEKSSGAPSRKRGRAVRLGRGGAGSRTTKGRRA
ncbi:MAG: metalloregulator ArsR/SmtB family transcription factor [Phycisphaerales bacterium]|nr:metalloregulator ArsR/SmtB family transcription factor [Phycisphaerales bacterium]